MVVGLVCIAAIVPIVGGGLFLAAMGRGFGYHGSDVAHLGGMFLAVVYFAAAFVTCLPQFPVVALQRWGTVLHFVIMPGSVVLICCSLGSSMAVYLVPGAVFAALWFVMARSVVRSAP